MATIVIILDVDVDPTKEDPHEIAAYLVDPNADDPMPKFRAAEWADGNPAISTFVSLWTP